MKSKLSIIKQYIRTVLHYVNYFLGFLVVELSGKRKESNRFLSTAKNKYNGQRCFIIGNGPSLTPEDLNCLENEITFASNRIYNIFEKTNWRPTFYTVFDEGVAKGEGVCEHINSFECTMKFFRQEGFFATCKVKGPKCYLHSWWSRKYLNNPQFSLNLEKGVYSIATVTYISIQLAVYMGFKEIYLLGMDNKYSITREKDGTISVDQNVKSYFSNETKYDKSVGATWEMDVAYSYAEEFSRKHGFRIFNATRGGYLEKFERVDLDTIFN